MPLSKLNNEQLAAATAPLGRNLVIASAGTGKTSTIVARIAHLLNSGTNPKKILLLTFTNKASKEMIARLERYFDKKITTDITAGTFHSVSYTLLRSLGKNIVLKQPSELKILLKSLVDKRKFSNISDIKPYSGAYLYDIYSLFQNKIIDGNFYNWFVENYGEQSVYVEIYEDILNEFEQRLGIKKGETTPDGKFSISETRCLGNCGAAPVVEINGEQVEHFTKDDVSKVLEENK